MTIYITELITGLLVIAGLFIWGESKSWLSLCSSHSNALVLDGFF